MAGLRFLSPMLHPRRRRRQRTVRGQSDWLTLLCRTLSFLIPSRFIPALSLTPFSLWMDETADMISQGRYRDAMAREIRDVRRAAREVSGNQTKYNQAIRDMMGYAGRSGQLPGNPLR